MDNEFNFEDLFPFRRREIELSENEKFGDNTNKVIGDRVKIIDYSSTSKYNGQPIDDEFNEMYDTKYFIVVETGCNVTLDIKIRKYLQDIVIVNPKNNKLFRISSKHVAIYNMNEILT